ncbi:MAG: hypothetical protein M3Y25_06870 [Thermoproteota archaeon]|nr:hypothetical protein [Thermoproteota archaeon]
MNKLILSLIRVLSDGLRFFRDLKATTMKTALEIWDNIIHPIFFIYYNTMIKTRV